MQHAYPALLTAVKQGKTSLEKLVEKACHNPAILFKIQNRGFLREGYFADLVLVDLNKKFTVLKKTCSINVDGRLLKELLLKQPSSKLLSMEIWFMMRGELSRVTLGKNLTYDR